MLRPMTSRSAKRRGNILIVTLSLLALLAVVGLTAVYYTKDQAERARIQGTPSGGDIGFADDGSGSAMNFLSCLIYDAQDHGPALLNSARGHSFVATMYGRRAGANIAWNGPGTFGGTSSFVTDRRQLLNHRLFSGMANISDPEYDGERAPGTTFPAPYGGTYYSKNAAYTYPDIKDLYLAALCPATGEVLVPSFHRPNVFGSLDPANPNWTSAAGRYMTLRPRPQEHPNFPRVPQNYDLSYTGDVQNLPGGFLLGAGSAAIARNDSIWIDTGLPAFTLPNGRRVKPLIAPLIVDLDGRLNLNVHGNVMNSGAHASGAGFGPWEVNLSKAFGGEGTGIVNARGLAATRAGISTRAFASRYPAGNEIPKYAQVPWTGFTGVNPLQLPGTTPPGDLFITQPTFSNGYGWTNAPFPNHPSLLNPNEWTNTSTPRVFPLSDTKLLSKGYAPFPTTLTSMAVGASAPVSLYGTPATYPVPNMFRNDPSHPNRMITTTLSASLQRSTLMPAAMLANDPNASTAVNLGPIDLNRTLADYRDSANMNAALSSTTMLNQAQADSDRQQFARDIFARLIAATSVPAADATISNAGVVTILAVSGTPGFETLRTLAQLSANIVDYIDNDDICTRFQWNAADVVYGVEKPRLVLNEAYAEIVNHPDDEAFTDPMKDAGGLMTPNAQVRFWLELQNPTSTPYTAATNGPLGDGSVSFGAAGIRPFKIQIFQNNQVAAGGVIGKLRLTTVPDAGYAANSTGDPGAGAKITFDFSTAAAGLTVPPANGVAGDGMVVCAANVPKLSPSGPEYMPAFPAAKTIAGAAVGAANSLTYEIPLPDSTTAGSTADDITTAGSTLNATLGRHVVVLQRLANPYLAFDATNNPYITVDVMDHVRAADRIVIAKGTKITAKRMPRAGAAPPGYEGSPQSVGKVQPYASYADPNATTTTATAIAAYPATSMVVQQDTASTTVKETFLRQNSKAAAAPAAATTPPTDTMVAPFDWLIHMDRPLINQAELLHVSIGRPHDVTFNFVGAGGTKYVGSAQAALLANTVPQIYRALDLLTVQPYGHQMALGGRLHGRINLNTIQDKRVWDALFDAQNTNNTFDQAYVDALWTTLMTSRTVNMSTRTDVIGTAHPTPVPGATVHDTGTAGGDRPFLPFGTATVTAGGGATFAAGVGLDDTLLRRVAGVPAIAVATSTHPYQQAEALRKILNNTTTVSHTFAVWVTVGYFEVEAETASPVGGSYVTLGREYYRDAPGDTRKKFFAIVDRSNIGYEPTEYGTSPAGGVYTQVARPFFTTVEENASIGATTLKVSTAGTGTVYVDGVAVTIGSTIVVGTGANQEIVTVTAFGAEVAGVTPLTVSATTKPHYAGECVSNIMLGNPGPPTDFDVNAAKYKAVVPLWVRLQ